MPEQIMAPLFGALIGLVIGVFVAGIQHRRAERKGRMNQKPALIVARTYRDAMGAVRELRLGPREYVYASAGERAEGLRFDRVVYVNGYTGPKPLRDMIAMQEVKLGRPMTKEYVSL